MSGGGNTIVIVTPDSEQFVEIAKRAKRGSDLASSLGLLMPNL
jgi:hypothetical protein